MEPEFITYQKFNDPALAEELVGLLTKHAIDYTVQEEFTGFDPSLAMGNEAIDYAVKIKSSDFDRANKLLTEYDEKNIKGVDADYYLFGFSDDELIEVVTKADEWSSFDVVLARKLLADRGKNISDEEIAIIHKKRLEDLKTPERPQTFWIIAGYIFAFGGGILGFFIGWHLSTYKKTLPNGQRVFGYIESDRKHGKQIFYLSFLGLAIVFIFKLLPAFSNN